MNIKKADNFLKRLKGLLFTKEISEDEGLLLKNCTQVHSFGMSYDLGVYYLDQNFEIIDTELLKRNRAGKRHKKTKHILEVHPVYVTDESLKIKIEQELKKEVHSHGRFI